MLSPDICARALDARDSRFDGLFFVGITTTGIYCRPVCPARISYPERRRFFETAASAEQAGFRPCLRCRPELAPGRALMDAVPRLARVAAHRIEAGALNGSGVGELAAELGVSERHLRRALERELGVSPIELAQTYRLLLAKRLLADTSLPVTRIAFASGFQSLRRFNSVFRERYRLSPTELRRSPRPSRDNPGGELIRLTLGYRPPFNWQALLESLAESALPGVEQVAGGSYARTVKLNGHSGVVVVNHAPERIHLDVDISTGLLPALMPLLARLRQLFDLDADPLGIESTLEQHGLASFVQERPGLRLPGALDGFEAAMAVIVPPDVRGPLVEELGELVETPHPALSRLSPDARSIGEAGTTRLVGRGLPYERARALADLARAVLDGAIRLEPGSDAMATHSGLVRIGGITDEMATAIITRALHWPDAFPSADNELEQRAEAWRPWRAYAALHLELGRAWRAEPVGA
jgi:AraC family transcriptional regulator of adaptative response / DNA-3-methyladenine glycosylase II